MPQAYPRSSTDALAVAPPKEAPLIQIARTSESPPRVCIGDRGERIEDGVREGLTLAKKAEIRS